MKNSLDAYRDPFKKLVSRHISKSLPASEWARFRMLAGNRQRSVDRTFNIDPKASPSSLLEVAVSEDSISVQETLIPALKAKATEIGQIEGQPVFYVNGEGIYLWGLDQASGITLCFWATYPAYPPSW